MSQQKYSEEFKDEAVRLSQQSGKSVRIVAEELSVSRAALQQWRQLRRSPRRRRGMGVQATTDHQKERPQISVDAEEYRQIKRELEQARQERDILKKPSASTLRRPSACPAAKVSVRMKAGFIREHAEQFDITVMCRVLGVSRSGYYAALNRPISWRAADNERLVAAITEVYSTHRQVYGSPRIWRQLRRQGVRCGRHRVAPLIRYHRIAASYRRFRRVTTDSRHALPVASNILGRDFRAVAMNQKWVADITYIRTEEGWLYLAVVMDLFSRRIIGWSMSQRINAELVLAAQAMALHARSPAPGLVHHTDRGSQYASDAYQQLLGDHRISASMSGVGNCYDNAAMESFFHTLKTELIYRRRYQTHRQVRAEIFEYIEIFYNRQRQHSTLGYKSPAEFEDEQVQASSACPL